VGRHPECDVVLDPAMRDVSRVHVLLDCTRREVGAEAEPGFVVRMTNLSAIGTYLSVSD
jgi:hypothetical protein